MKTRELRQTLKLPNMDWFTGCRASDTMIFFSTPERDQQARTPPEPEQTADLPVVLILVDMVRMRRSSAAA